MRTTTLISESGMNIIKHSTGSRAKGCALDKILIIGNGSIGKRHANNVLKLGYAPIVLTNHPDNTESVTYINSFSDIKDVQHAIISTPTAKHLSSVENLLKATKCKNILVEKPISSSLEDANKIKQLAEHNSVEIFVAYNMRFLRVFDVIKKLITDNKNDIRLVHIVAGQYLPDWRPNSDYRASYSAHRDMGGGVDLDFSHEIDYMNWCFQEPKSINACVRKKISKMDINSPDYFKGIYEYNNFIVEVELDYFRKKERTLRIIAENKELLFADFINKTLIVNNRKIEDKTLFDLDESYLNELKEFLSISNTKKLTTLGESISILTLLMLEEQ